MNQHQRPDGARWDESSLPASATPFVDAVGGGWKDQWAGLADLMPALRRSRFGLVLWTALCLGLTALYLYRAQPEFVATTQVVLEPRRPVPGTLGGSAESFAPSLDSAQADSQVQVLKSERNLRFVFDMLNLADDPAFAGNPGGLMHSLLGLIGMSSKNLDQAAQTEGREARAFQAFSDRVGVRRVGQSYALEIAFRAPNATQAARLANSVTAAYILGQIQYHAAAVQRGTEFLQGRIADIKAEQDIAVDAVKRGIIPDAQFADADARVVSAATVPLSKSFPQPVPMVVLTLIFALISGIGAVALRHSFDRRVRSREQVGQALGIDCLSLLPRVAPRRGMRADNGDLSLSAVIDAPTSHFSEAMRVLRTGLLSLHKPSRKVAIGIASWSSGEGRSVIAANLAMLMAASSDHVVLIDGDLHSPRLSHALAPTATSGLAERLLGHEAQVPLEIVAVNDWLEIVPATGAGKDPDPNVFIGSSEMEHVLRSLRQDRDIVVDLAPMSLSSDTQAIGPLLDGVLLVVEADRTTLDEVSEVVRSLRSANTRLIGIVLNKVSTGATPRRRDRPGSLRRSVT